MFRIAAVLLVLAPMSFAQNEGHSQPPSNGRLPEEIVITGERSLLNLRLEMQEAERAAYALFNQLNDEDRFDISCKMEAQTGTRIKRQLCLPEFKREALREHARAYIEGSPSRNPPVEMVIASQEGDFKLKMEEVAEQHPEFLEAIILYSVHQERYKEATRTVWGADRK